jgi:hypothetical protein
LSQLNIYRSYITESSWNIYTIRDLNTTGSESGTLYTTLYTTLYYRYIEYNSLEKYRRYHWQREARDSQAHGPKLLALERSGTDDSRRPRPIGYSWTQSIYSQEGRFEAQRYGHFRDPWYGFYRDPGGRFEAVDTASEEAQKDDQKNRTVQKCTRARSIIMRLCIQTIQIDILLETTG